MLSAGLLLPGLFAARMARAQVGPDEATQFIQETGVGLIRLMTGAHDLDARRQLLAPFVDQVVDVDGVARFCIGRGWQAATDAQRVAYLLLFRLVLVNSIAGHLGGYEPGEVTIATGRASPRPEGMLVPTTISRPNNKPVAISWLVTDVGGRPKIADVLAEGVSLRVTQRSDYASFLNRSNGQVEALTDALQRQAEALHLS